MRHRYKEFECCPLCFGMLVWKYDGIGYVPCTHEPVLFRADGKGKTTVFKNGELIEKCTIYRGGEDIEGYTMGLIPHCITCEELI